MAAKDTNLPWPIDAEGKKSSMMQFLNQGPNWIERLLPVAGFSLPALANRLYFRRPWYANIYLHVAMGGTFFALARLITKYQADLTHKREVVTYDYLRLHPELLEDQKPKKVAEILVPWRVCR